MFQLLYSVTKVWEESEHANRILMDNLYWKEMGTIREALMDTSQGDYWPDSSISKDIRKWKELLQIMCGGSSFSGNEST